MNVSGVKITSKSLLFFKLLCLVPNSQQKKKKKKSYGEDDGGMYMWQRTVYTMVDRKQRVWEEPEVGYNSVLLPSARIWFLKVSWPPKIVPSHGETGGPNQSLWPHFSTNPSHVLSGACVHFSHLNSLNHSTLNETSHGWHCKGPLCAGLYYCVMPDIENNAVFFFILPSALDEVNHFLQIIKTKPKTKGNNFSN